jgi:hypothetical protein
VTEESEQARTLIKRIAARPRFAGSEAENLVRDECESTLRALGFQTRRDRFNYSGVPAKLGPAICSLLFAAGMYAAGHAAALHHEPGTGLLIIVLTLVVTSVIGRFLLARVLSFPGMRSASTNLVATRGGVDPDVWLVAHLDSKSQTIRMLIRVASIGTASFFLVITMCTMLAQLVGLPVNMGFPAEFLPVGSGVAAVLTSLAILPVAFCFVTNRSPGALDNATGVASVLLALERLPAERKIGVLFPSAEELGLAGARAFIASRSGAAIAINCDTIDNDGGFICMTNNRRGRSALALASAAASHGHSMKIRRMIRGILTDSIPLAQAGWDACTLSRGNLATLSRVHTSSDEPDRIDGTGVAIAARILAATVEGLT